jgi:uroporphyrinogen III methyltransferase/synthase
VSGRRGKVTLVGAGPGAPDLITLRGLAALREADVVVYDSLAPAALLDEAPAGAERIDVGRRGHEEPTRTQEDISKLLVERARAGLRVVRLKGGDPYVFGRGGEEGTACAAAGVEFDVVPGVSAAFAVPAAAGIPLTDRRYAASFAVVTGHKDPSAPRERLDLEGLARSADTLVILMGMRNLDSLVARVLAGGRDPATPAAAVMHGTTARQRTVEAPLAELPARVREAGLGAPAVVVIGDVVRLRGELARFERMPLFGARVLVTRPREQAGGWLAALRAAGAEASVVPMIRIEPAGDPEAQEAALRELDGYDAVLFASANAVRAFAARAGELGASLAGRRPAVLCVGPATAAAAREAGLRVDGTPAARFDAEGLLEVVREEGAAAGRRFLLPRAAGGRELVAERLREAGAAVDAVVFYRSATADTSPVELHAALAAGEFDTLVFASPSAARHFAGLLDEGAREAARRCTVAAIGPVTAQALAELGLPADVVAARAEADELVEALAAHRARARRMR